MTIRTARREDLPQVACLQAQLFRLHRENLPEVFRDGFEYTEKDLAEKLADPDGIALVAEEDGAVVGLCFGRVAEDEPDMVLRPARYGDLEDLVVQPGQRGKGLGRALLTQAKAEAARLGATAVRLRVFPFNMGAEKLYHEMGFALRWSELECKL